MNYLGYPIFNTKQTPTHFQYLLDNFKNKLSGWKTNFLTMAGQTILINVALNCLPNHVMQLIKIPTNIITKLERYQRNFLWGTTPQKCKLHLIKWATVQLPKAQGELGIQNLHHKNNALLGSLAWRLFQSPSSYWAKVILLK